MTGTPPGSGEPPAPDAAPPTTTATVAESRDAAAVRRAIVDELQLHVRVIDQGLAPDAATRTQLAAAVPPLRAFGSNRYEHVAALLDWDHRLPSEQLVLRLFGSYSGHEARRLQTRLRARDEQIRERNLYPEFDVPDYGQIDASEEYALAIELAPAAGLPGGGDSAAARLANGVVGELRFLSDWRRHVSASAAQTALATVRGAASYAGALARRRGDGLGGAAVVGWVPPALARSDRWCVEVWLITAFDGHRGTARVFVVDTDTRAVTAEYDTAVQLG